MTGNPRPKIPRKPKIPPRDPDGYRKMSADQTLEFILGVRTDEWGLSDIRGGVTEDGLKVTHITLEFKGSAGRCPACGKPTAIHDYKDRSWRHSNLDDTVCYLYARVPRCRCDGCGTVTQVQVPWADPGQSYTHRFEELATGCMSQMSIAAASRLPPQAHPRRRDGRLEEPQVHHHRDRCRHRQDGVHH